MNKKTTDETRNDLIQGMRSREEISKRIEKY